MTSQNSKNTINQPNLDLDDDPPPDNMDSDEGYAWARRHEPRPDLQLIPKTKREVRRMLKPHPSLRCSAEAATTGPDKDSAREDLYCKGGKCGRKSQSPRRHKCQNCHKLMSGEDLLHEDCARRNNRCPRCGKYHDRNRPDHG